MGFNVPTEGDILSETDITEFFAWLRFSGVADHKLAPEILRAIPKIGDRTTEGTLYAGISPATNKAMFTTPHDAPSLSTLQQAESYATELADTKGRKGFRLPERGELSLLWNNGFTKSESPSGHWSRTEDSNDPGNKAIARQDRDGEELIAGKDARLKVRPIRYGEPKIAKP